MGVFADAICNFSELASLAARDRMGAIECPITLCSSPWGFPVTDLHAKPTLTVSVLLAIAQIVVWGGSFFLMAVLAAPVVKDTGWSQQWVYGSLSLGILISGLLAPKVGREVARIGGRMILAGGGLVIALGLVLLACAPNLPCFVLAWVVIGVGMALGLYDPLFATLGQRYGDNARSAITQVTLISGFCTSIVWPLIAVLIAHLGWRDTCLVYSVAVVLLSVPIYLGVFPKSSAAPEAQTVQRSVEHAPSTAAQEQMFNLLTISFILASVVMTAISVQLISLLQAQGISLAAALGIAALIGPAQVGARAIDIFTGRQSHPIWSTLGSSLLVALGLACVMLSPAMAALGIVLYGAGSGIRSIVRGTLPLALFGPRIYPIMLGRIARPTLIAQALTPLGGGYLQAHYGATVTLAALGVLALFNIVFVLILLMQVRKVQASAAQDLVL
ncbi:MAG: major facilitator transporter [Pseudomonas sp.]|nr:major facilitator transporter [Pseudomonas sp.]